MFIPTRGQNRDCLSMPADAVVVFGAGVINGNEPTPSTRAAAKKALQLFNTGEARMIIPTGLGPVEGIDPEFAEAEVVKTYLIDQGVDEEFILTRPNSTSTVGNWVEAVMLAREHGIRTVTGIARSLQYPRVNLIGKHVTQRGNMKLLGQHVIPESSPKSFAQDLPREAANLVLTGYFLEQHKTTPLEELPVVYEAFKGNIGLGAVKRFIHRKYQTGV